MKYTGEDNLNIMALAKRYNHFLCRLVEKSITHSNMKIVDFGAGTGFFAKKMIANQITCIEPAENLWKYHLTQPLKSTSELPNNATDLIYSFNVLEHIENDQPIIEEFYRVLKPNGTVILYLPAFPALYSSMDKLVGHYRRYTVKDVNRLFHPDKWEIKQKKYADFCGFFITLLFKLIGNKSGEISPTSLKIYDSIIFPVSLFFDKITAGKILGKNIIIEVTKKDNNKKQLENENS